MAFTVRDFHDLVGLLQQHPEWRAELRRLVLSDEILGLPEVVRQIAEDIRVLAETQKRTELRVEELAEAQKRTELRVEELAEAQKRTEQRLETLAARVDALAQAQLRTEQRLDALAAQVSRLTGVVGNLVGKVLEWDYREKAHSYFLKIMLGIRSVPRDEIAAMAADAERRALLSIDDHADLMQADVVVRGRLRDRDADGYLVAEVSSVVDTRDVQRAAHRAKILERIVSVPVVAAVAGERFSPEADLEATAAGVWRVLDGRAFPPGAPAAPASA
jgi:hypothetical protein